FTLLNTGTFWLSETPEEPSKGWDAAFNRVVTWGQFESIHFGERFYVFNTHFDHVGIEARINSAELIKNKIQEMTNNFNDPVILTGDFNLTPDTEPIKQLKETFNDSREVSVEAPYGPVGTFNGFKLETDL